MKPLVTVLCGVGIILSAQIFRPGGPPPTSTTGYLPNKAVRTDGAGRLATVFGNDSDCVHVDGSASACGGGSSVIFVDGETPAGAVDGSNAAFVLAYSPVTGSVRVFRNGIRQKLSSDYTIAGATITFVSASKPQSGDTVLVDYRR